MHKLALVGGIGAALFALTGGFEQGPANTPPKLPRILAESAERDLALEALPPAMRSGAGVWIMTARGMRLLRKATNGYTCVVNRDEVLAIKPTCYDAEGAATILPAVIRFGELLLQGKPVAAIKADVAEGFRTGKFRTPSRAGIAFMMSPRIVNVIDADKGTVGTAPPHYMIYAPNVTNAQLSIPNEAYNRHPWLPYVAYTGPQGFIIVTIPDSAVVGAGHTMHASTPPAVATTKR